jgi:hypothetical protein
MKLIIEIYILEVIIFSIFDVFLTFKYSVSKENTKFYDYYNDREITPSDMLYIIIQSNKAKLSNNLVNVIKKYFNIF